MEASPLSIHNLFFSDSRPCVTWGRRVFLFLVVLALLAGCAGQAPPPGGPVDTIPPTIVRTYPENNTTYFSDDIIILEFDEYVERASVGESIFISPDVGRLEFDWSGREVEITFSDTLRSNTTYVLTVGTDVLDIRNKNRMAQAVTVAFSTGGQIDPGGIEGTVFPSGSGAPPEGVMILAYRLDELERDTLDPRWTRPDYVTQTGKGGRFSFRHLVLGSYRLIALEDQYKNFLYDPETDAYAVPSQDFELRRPDTLLTGVLMRLAREDTTQPRLMKITPRNQRLIVAEFSEPLDGESIKTATFAIRDTLQGDTLQVLSASPLYQSRTEILLATRGAMGGAGFVCSVEGIRDSSGLEISPLANTLTFTGSMESDSALLQVSKFSIPDSSSGVPVDGEIQIAFSRPLRQSIQPGAIVIKDTSNVIIPARIQLHSDLVFGVEPKDLLQHGRWYRLMVSLAGLTDVFGRSGADTVITLRFGTRDREILSSIEGFVIDAHPTDGVGEIHIAARDATKREVEIRSAILPKPGAFQYQRLPEGRYVLGAFRDRNGNGLFDPGRVFPYEKSERFSVYKDTLRLRARWPLEGVVIELR